MEILGEFLGKNAKKMVHRDVENKIVIAKRHGVSDKIITRSPSLLVCF